MYETLIFTGGVHKSEEIKELIEDLGGFILQDNIMQMELVLNMAVPLNDVNKITNMNIANKRIGGQDRFDIQCEHDKRKLEYAKSIGLELIVIDYKMRLYDTIAAYLDVHL